MSQPLTGRKVAGIFVGGFAIVIAVNMWMAHLATATFGGVVVENSYVASQNFNRWLDEAAAERALGWSASMRRDAGGHLLVQTSGIPADARIEADIRHPLGRLPDRQFALVAQRASTFASRDAIPAGRWIVRLSVTAAGHHWNSERSLP